MVRNKRDRFDHTEYGGGEGSIPRLPTGGEGTEIPLKSIPGRNGDAARVVRQAGVRGDMGLARPGRGGEAESLAYQEKVRRDLGERTADYGRNAPGLGERLN